MLSTSRDKAQCGPTSRIELALGQLAQRDYAGALQTFERSMGATGGKVSVGGACLLLYLLGKNDKTDDARSLIATLDPTKTPGLERCIDWFETKFDGHTALPPTSSPR